VPVESLFGRLEPLLAQVQKPIQYVGGELNSTVKDWDACDVRWALMYPDAYEVGLPNQGIQILYEVLNERPDVLARWAETLRQAKDLGVVDIQACSLSMDLLHLEATDLDPLVDGVEQGLEAHPATPSLACSEPAQGAGADEVPV